MVPICDLYGLPMSVLYGTVLHGLPILDPYEIPCGALNGPILFAGWALRGHGIDYTRLVFRKFVLLNWAYSNSNSSTVSIIMKIFLSISRIPLVRISTVLIK